MNDSALEETIKVPEVLPLLPVRDVVVFPYMILPLFVSREMSIGAVDAALSRDRLIMLAAQKNVSDDDPSPRDIYAVGTVAMIMRMLKLPDGRVKILVQGLSKARITDFEQRTPIFQVRVDTIAEQPPVGDDLEIEALMRTVKEQLEQVSNYGKVMPSDVMMIVDGLPPSTTIEMEDSLDDYICEQVALCSLPLAPGECEAAGGSLGGHGHCFESTLFLELDGTGDLAGFERSLAVPVFCEIHTGPRNPGDPVQTFSADIYRLLGELFGDPDFCAFTVTAGTDFGLPCPGEITLTELPSGDFAVESFFDVTYTVNFTGCPGSILEGRSGTTLGTIRWEQGGPSLIEEFDLAFVITGEADCDCLVKGDVNNDGVASPLDVAFLVKYVYLSQDALAERPDCPYPKGDMNCDDSVSPLDVSFLVSYVYKSLDALCDGCVD